MKTTALIILLLLLSRVAKPDAWTQKASLPTVSNDGRVKPFYFSIGSKCYLGTGGTSTGGYSTLFWEYDVLNDTWTQKANFAGIPRVGSSGFSIGNKGYAGIGYGNASSYLEDFWEYDPATNTWTQKADFGGGVRGFAFSFSTATKGYITTGFKSSPTFTSFNDLWEYNPVTDAWLQKTSLPSFARNGAAMFTIGNDHYLIGGASSGSLFYNDVWLYDVSADAWTQKANFAPGTVADATGFAVCGRGYICCGEGPIGTWHNYLWQYSPVTNAWTQKTDYPETARDGCVAFSYGNKAYFGLGGVNLSATGTDFYEYTPDSACATGIEESINDNVQFTVAPNPAKDFIEISLQVSHPLSFEIKIIDESGKISFSKKINSGSNNSKQLIDISALAEGIYFVHLSNANEKTVKFIKY